MEGRISGGDDEKDDVVDRLIVEGLVIEAVYGATEHGDDVVDRVGERVWDGDAVADACADEFLALFERADDVLAQGGAELAVSDEAIDQLVDRGLVIVGA